MYTPYEIRNMSTDEFSRLWVDRKIDLDTLALFGSPALDDEEMHLDDLIHELL